LKVIEIMNNNLYSGPGITYFDYTTGNITDVRRLLWMFNKEFIISEGKGKDLRINFNFKGGEYPIFFAQFPVIGGISATNESFGMELWKMKPKAFFVPMFSTELQGDTYSNCLGGSSGVGAGLGFTGFNVGGYGKYCLLIANRSVIGDTSEFGGEGALGVESSFKDVLPFGTKIQGSVESSGILSIIHSIGERIYNLLTGR
jgi:hypothetical protein